MSRTNFVKTSFAAGQISPRVSRRVDTDHFFNGASQIENFVCLPFGGVEKTPGTMFVREARDSSKPVRLFDFIFNRRDAYVMAFNDSKIRFFKDRGVVSGANAITITAITNANPGVVTAASHGLSNGDRVTIQGVDGMTEVNGVEYTVANKTTDTFELSGVNTTSYGTFILSSYTKLLIHGNTTIADATGTHTPTANGNAALTTNLKKFGNGAYGLDGSGDYITYPDSAAWAFAGDFTMEIWVRFNATPSGSQTLFHQANDGGTYMEFRYNGTSGQWQFQADNTIFSYASPLAATDTPAANTWYHMAVVRSGNTFYMFKNGSQIATGTDSDTFPNYSGPMCIGASDYNGAISATQFINGYIDEARISNTARYTTGFAVETAAFSDDANTVLLVHFDSDASDSSSYNHTPTVNGGAFQIGQSKLGGGSIYFDGTGDYISIPDHADLDFGTADFTIDLWVRFKTLGIGHGFMHRDNGGGNGWQFVWSSASGGQLIFQAGGANLISKTWAPVVDTWYHIAVSRSGTDLRLFVDGTQLSTTETDSTDLTYTSALEIGTGDTGRYLHGWIDELRIMKGYARYTANFTAPTAESPVGTATTVAGVYEVTHTYTDAELFDIQTAQASDIMYITHPDHKPAKLSRFGDAEWTLADVDFQDGPYLDENTTATTLDPNGTSGSVTVTASAVTGINDGDGFQTTDVGRLIRYYDGTNYFWMKITARASTTEVTATIQHRQGVPATTTMGGHAATALWSLGAWSDTTGWPHAVVFHQSRLWFAGTDAQPQHVWGSVIEEYENFLAGADDEDAVIIPIATNRVNIIEWLASEKRLVIGTAEQIFTAYAGTVAAEGITPSNVKVDPETNWATSPVVPEQIGSFLYYVGADTKKLREFSYGFDIDRYRSVDRQILSDDITGTGVKEMAFQKSPSGVLYCVLNDGNLATLTREIDQQVNAWTKQTTDGTYESVTVIPTDGYDEVWFVVNRTINGSTKRYIEYQVNPNQAKDSNIEDQILLHSALTYDSSPTSTVTGLDHLEGEAVHALCDGVKVTGTVSSGSLALGASYSTVQVGLPYTGKIKLLPPEAGSQYGTAQGLMKRAHEILVSVYRTLGLKVGEDGGNMESMRTGAGAVPTTLQTDDFTFPGTIGWDRKNEIYFEAADPHPCTILLVALLLQVNEK